MTDWVRLPLDCDIRYRPNFLSEKECDEVVSYLDGVAALHDMSIRMADGSVQHLDTGRYMLLDANLTGHDAMPEVWGAREAWPEFFAPIKQRVDAAAGRAFQVCRVILYPDGESGVDWHADLMAYGDTSVIASLSLGAERVFALRKKSDPSDRHELVLGHGSLLVMGPGTQDQYEHSVPRDPACSEARYNLTFRRYG